MASTATEHTATCLVCYESRPLKIVGNCKHSFCTECLSTVFESLDSGTEVFECPSCKVDCPRPWDGVKGLVDYTGKDSSKTAVVMPVNTQGRSTRREKKTAPEKKKQEIVETKCQLCRHKKKEVLAVSMCAECGNFYFCQDCTNLHARNKATEKHYVTVLTPIEKTVVLCEDHDTNLTNFCQTCSKAVCTICVMLDHGDHTIHDLDETIDSKVDLLKLSIKKQEKKLTELQDLKKKLTQLKTLAPMVDKQDVLIKQIEDHAEKYINQILKWKVDLKTQVTADFQVIRDIPKGLEKVSEVVQSLQEAVSRAAKLITERDHHPAYLDKLVALQKELKDTDVTGSDAKDSELRNKLFELDMNNYSFVPRDIPTTFGEVEKKSGAFKLTEIFQKTFRRKSVNSEDMFIPCVANLGERFAVAHPTKKGEYSNAIDIYEFPGTLIKTLKNHVPPIADMSSTPDGKLAVLSHYQGTYCSSCSVKLFDSETGYISSTCDISDVKPLSLGATLQNQYVILGDNQQGQKVIIVVDEEGAVQHTHVMNQGSEKVINPNTITYGGSFIFVKGDKQVGVFEIKGTGLQAVRTVKSSQCQTAISATVWDDFLVASYYRKRQLVLDRYQHKADTLEWSNNGFVSVCNDVTGANMDSSVSTRNGRVVMSLGCTIKVFKC